LAVLGDAESLPRLAGLCGHDHLETSLAAERSIEEFTGIRGDEALVACTRGNRHAAHRAMSTLIRRNPDLARRVLLAMPIPTDGAGSYTFFLLEAADASYLTLAGNRAYS
jgi:hypothetical protein